MTTLPRLDEPGQRVMDLCLALPEATASSRTGQHVRYDIRGRTFCYHTVDHHGDGRVALNCKVAPGMQGTLVDSNPARFFIPSYLGPKGWVGLDLDAPPDDWDEVRWLVTESYRLIAPKRLAALVG